MRKLFCDRRTVIEIANGEPVTVCELTVENPEDRSDSFDTVGYLFEERTADALTSFLNLHDFASLLPN